MANEDNSPTATAEKKSVRRTKMIYGLVEVHRIPSSVDMDTGEESNDDAGEVSSYEPIDLPTEVKGVSRDEIMRGLTKAIKNGNTAYDGKELLIVTYTAPFTISVENTRSVTIS